MLKLEVAVTLFPKAHKRIEVRTDCLRSACGLATSFTMQILVFLVVSS